MKKNIKRSVFSLALCAMLVFCISFYSSVEPTTAWFSDTGDQTGSFNMDEIEIIFAGDGITGESGNQTANTIELNFKAATKSADEENDGKPEPMFEYAAEFYTFKATNISSGTKARLRVNVDTDTQELVRYGVCVYELSDNQKINLTEEKIRPFLTETETTTVASAQSPEEQAEETTTEPLSDTVSNWKNVYIDSKGNRVIKGKDTDGKEVYYDAYLLENLEKQSDLILEPEKSKIYCIAIWVEYNDEFVFTDGVDNLSGNATISISAEQVQETEKTSAQTTD